MVFGLALAVTEQIFSLPWREMMKQATALRSEIVRIRRLPQENRLVEL